jgi:methionine synthase II (cobalamin-independent)
MGDLTTRQYERTLQEEVAGVVRKQADLGIDIVSDGEYGKAGWIRYVAERLGGFVHREIRPGDHEHNPIYVIREAQKFPEFYAAYTEILACEEAGITVTLPKPMTSNAKGGRTLRQAGLPLCG